MKLRIAFFFVLLGVPHLASAAETAPPRHIFDGQTLKGWKGVDGLWKVEDGAITGETTVPNQVPHNTFLVWEDGGLDDFVLTFDYRIVGGNSGVQIRSWPIPGTSPEEFRFGGYQADIDSGATYSGIVYEEGGRGIVANRGQKTRLSAGEDGKTKIEVLERFAQAADLEKGIKKEDWNSYKIVATGNTLTNYINGVKSAEVIDDQPENARRSGVLALQIHRWETPMKVQFKNIQLQRLPLQDQKKIAFFAGRPSHGPGEHEHRAGCLLLAEQLNKYFGDKVLATVYTGGWPNDPSALDNVDAVVSFTDGGGGHPLNYHVKELDEALKRGVGLGCIHYAVETTKGEFGEKFLEWIGGYFEPHWSVNPHWSATYASLPEHEVTRGVQPFGTHDEWYYHMRFRPQMKDVTPILTALPPPESLSRPDGPHSGNPFVRDAVAKGEAQHTMWVATRDKGKGRGFGCTGSHFHKNWGDDNYRKLILNACAWIAQVEIPAEGVPAPALTAEELTANQDQK